MLAPAQVTPSRSATTALVESVRTVIVSWLEIVVAVGDG
jgi:hypothetical protein